MTMEYDIKQQNIPNDQKYGHKIDQDFQLQGPPKFTQIGIFRLKVYHLATLGALLAQVIIFYKKKKSSLDAAEGGPRGCSPHFAETFFADFFAARFFADFLADRFFVDFRRRFRKNLPFWSKCLGCIVIGRFHRLVFSAFQRRFR
jgi:hypothetical protein